MLTTGEANTGLGWRVLYSVGVANFNTGVGAGALSLNIGDDNTAVGAAALILNIPGTDNTAVGSSALQNNFSGAANTAVGSEALLFNDQTGHGAASGNTAVGQRALFNNIDASANTAVGSAALANNDSTGNALAINNTAVGFAALFNNTDGASNNAVGQNALVSNTIGNNNTAIGTLALSSNTIGSSNEAMGINALLNNVDGGFNVAMGDSALAMNVDGEFNVAVGSEAGTHVTGNNNTLIGAGAGFDLTTGEHNICIGTGVNGHAGEDHFIRINNNNLQVAGTTSQVFVGGINGATVGAANSPVLVNANGQLGTAPSSARFKKDIESMGKASEAIYSLRPVTFRYKGDETNLPCFGLIAEEVAKVNLDLILLDKGGKPQTVRYEQVNAMLLNEFLKEHKKVQELEANGARQQKQIETLIAGLQKVNAQLELSKSAPQTVLNNR